MPKRMLRIDISQQTIVLLENGDPLLSYPVSTGRNGAGEQLGSGCTPRGLHKIRLKIGSGCPESCIFVGRRATGEIYTPALAAKHPERDWILTRILWLTGLESGLNRGGSVDTLRRYIYIHGSPDSEPFGVPVSHGCIRMRNHDLLDLFEQVETNMLVEIR
ncbi:MAG: hypothetical protein DIZ78_08755 [endosymbiont of Escarpia spicata]|uniref:L,D-TPase catalytic domain-containing protein n=1 Tax=endosymbiont of Escarpia spicata TaxID=2200908 RepID=A0A370DMW6_9GAMM|nr:MAG: hypothetical protein DIZ78_08755 [endosymbiont of Escarpia spicata]